MLNEYETVNGLPKMENNGEYHIDIITIFADFFIYYGHYSLVGESEK